MVMLGLVGGGGHGLEHLKWASTAGFQGPVVVFDPDPDGVRRGLRQKKIRQQVRFVESMKDLLATSVQAVIIASPDADHPAQLSQVLGARRHVLIEKPAAIDPAGLKVVTRALSTSDKLVVSSCHPRRFDSPYVALRDAHQRLVQQYGALCHIVMDFSYPAPQREWKGVRSLLLDHFPHELDWMRWFLGRPALIRARRHWDGADGYAVSGTIGDVGFWCSGSRRLNVRGAYPETITLRFERGTCEVNTLTGEMLSWPHEAPDKRRRWPKVVTQHDARCAAVTTNFAQAVQGGWCYLTKRDILVNTAASVALARVGSYEG